MKHPCLRMLLATLLFASTQIAQGEVLGDVPLKEKVAYCEGIKGIATFSMQWRKEGKRLADLKELINSVYPENDYSKRFIISIADKAYDVVYSNVDTYTLGVFDICVARIVSGEI